MAIVVSHAMRRFASSPDANYSSCGLRSESRLNWSQEAESSLSRSMRYADPWLYDSVRTQNNGLLLAPALVLCSCADYLNGTKKSSKKGTTTCKKCKGTRIPLPNGDSKFGTMRCFPTTAAALTHTPQRAGTVRVTSAVSRPSILPDPYDLMRRSRLTVVEKSSQFRARSVSPNKAKPTTTTANDTRKSNNNKNNGIKYPTVGRRSILECNVNPYELIAADTDVDASITRLNGQRIRVRPPIAEPDYEDVQLKTPRREIPKFQINRVAKIKSTITSNNNNNNENECNRFKSILKKPTTTFGDTDSNCARERSPSPIIRSKSGSHFYLPMPPAPRKKVQFLVENDSSDEDLLASGIETNGKDDAEVLEVCDKTQEENSAPKETTIEAVNNAQTICRLRRSESERILKEQTNKVIFHDSMALRSLQTRTDARVVFSEKDLERLDGISYTKLTKNRPKDPPPEPPKKNEPPAAPPRKRSINKQQTPMVVVEYNNINNKPAAAATEIVKENYAENRTVLQINTSDVHKLKIKNEFPETDNVNTISVTDSALGKTSIMINGDDCYSTVKVCDEIPLYHSSVVVKDSGVIIPEKRNSSSVYITGNFAVSVDEESSKAFVKVNNERDDNVVVDVVDKSEDILKCLSNPVEAVRMNLVPHVCGRGDPPRRPQKPPMLEEPLKNLQLISEEDKVARFIEESFIKLRNNKILDVDGDKDSEHSSSTQYEIMDHGSDCYTDHSNRSSITEEELNARTKFYELLADSAIVEVENEVENEDHHYETIKINQDPIYEEIEIPPPLPSNPPPASLLDDLQLDKEYTTRSIFEGASKYDILSYLVDAKERGIVQEDTYTYNFANSDVTIEEEAKDNCELPYNRVSHMSTVSDSSEDSSLVMTSDDKTQRTVEVERNDSGVGSETSKSSLSKYRSKSDHVINQICEDCEASLESQSEHEPLICRKCSKKRAERKEIITEIVETEEKYSRDLQIILEEFYQPMLVAGLLTSDQLSAIFLNVEELLENSQALAERLRDAVEIAVEHGDEDLQTVNIGKLVLEAAPMLHAFETYCVRQGAASLLLASLEKEKELLRIFLRVSQMENAVLRRMNLNSFLMVPVQRVTKYPLLLARLYKVTPSHFENKDQLKDAQHKIELHLNHMNSETKDVPSKLWRRISSIPGRRSSSEMDLVNIKLRKIAVDVLEWNHDEAKFALEGRLLFTQPTDNNWRKGRTIKLTPINALLVTNGKSTSTAMTRNDPNDESLVFSRQAGVRDAALLLVRDKNGRYSLLREPLYLDRCVIAADPAWQSYFEVQELLGKDTFIFKAEDEEQTKLWYRQLQYYAQGMGAWRKRRNALANIMINGMGLRS